MENSKEMREFLTISQKLIGASLLFTDMEQSIFEINDNGEFDFSKKKITEDLKNLKINEPIIKIGEEEVIPLLEEHNCEIKTELITPIFYNGKQFGFVAYHCQKGMFEEEHKAFANTAREFVEKIIAKEKENI